MSHQTGITCGDELKQAFCESTTEGNIRALRILIENETMVLSESTEKTSESWEDDFEKVTKGFYKPKQPCYVLFQLETRNNWLLVNYIPEDSPVREKMLYAATRATLKSEFGGGFINEEYNANSRSELKLEAYKSFTNQDAPPPLTYAEMELKEIKLDESKSSISTSTRHQTVQGVAFPITNEVKQALLDFADGIINHIELCVDVDKEIIFMKCGNTISAAELEDFISSEYAAYHVFKYAHRHNDEDIVTNFFIYYMPGYSVPVKHRMLYSSCKAPLISMIEEDYEIALHKKVECDKNDKITEEFLRLEVHPPAKETKKAFSKPKAPGRRAPTRKPNRNGA